jgi:hypothetical protein
LELIGMIDDFEIDWNWLIILTFWNWLV